MYITIETARKHLNLDSFFIEDDEYILYLIKVAEDAVEKRIGKKLSECIDKNGELENSIKHSILVLISTYYNQREATSPSTISDVPYTFDFLASLNQRYTNF